MGLFEKIFGSYSQRELKNIRPIVDRVLSLEDKYKAMSDRQLQEQTPALKARLAAGETLDDILPDAFAVCREAADRVLGMRPFPVQVLGGVVLHQGRISEMKTGEGKTLVATLPAYLNALEGKGVHIVTVNDYLAKRDSEWMGKVYRFFGTFRGADRPRPQLRSAPSGLRRRHYLRHQQRNGILTICGITWPSARKIRYSAAIITPLWTRWTPF